MFLETCVLFTTCHSPPAAHGPVVRTGVTDSWLLVVLQRSWASSAEMFPATA